MLSGPIEVDTKDTLASVNFVATHVLFRANEEIDFEPKGMCSNLEQKVQSLWDLDSIGIRDHETVHEAFLKNISFEKGRYTVQLPFRNHHDLIPDNYELSLARLNSLVKHLRKEPSLLRDYNQIINEQLEKGIAETVHTKYLNLGQCTISHIRLL